MMNLLRLIPLLLVLGALSALAGEERQSLDGRWAFTIDESRLDRPVTEWDTLPVPGNWDTVNAYSQHVGRGWYRREFAVPSTWRGQRVRLHFHAVYETAEVTLNGRVLGRHEGGYTPFEFDVTDLVRWDAPNTVTVMADNTYKRGAWWPWGGISRSVELVANDAVRLQRQHIRPELDLATGAATVHLDYVVENNGVSPATVQLAAEARFGDRPVGSTTLTVAVPAGGTVRRQAAFTVAASDVRRWHFDTPHLYRLTTAARVAGAEVHTRTDRFGVRKVEVKPDGLYLNGEKVRLVGFNRVHDHRAYGNTEPDHLVRLDIDRMKRYGSNFTRIMHAPAAPNLLDYLDEKGMLVFTEIPVWGEKDPNAFKDNPRTKQWLREMIERDYNHPSIIGWSVGNELLEHYDYVKSMIDHVRSELDPHRLITYVSFSGGRPQYTPTNDPITVSDLIMYNTYGANAGNVIETLGRKWPGRPVFLAELGGRQFGETLDSRIDGIEERWASLTDRPSLIGASLWTYNDYRSNYRGSAPGELRSWGMVNLWRRDKAAARDVARLHSPLRQLRVVDGHAVVAVRGPDEFPSYTLRGHRLIWEWRRPDGRTLAGGLAALPDLAPGAAPVRVPLSPAPAGAGDAMVVATVINPLGYVVHTTSLGGEPAAPPPVTGSSAPVIHHVEPLADGFMVGYSTELDDESFTLEYGTTAGTYDRTLTVAQKGALAVHGLEAGRAYFLRLRREVTGRGPSAWSEERRVVPDGGLPPAAPTLLGVVRGDGMTALRVSPVPKATGYRVRWTGATAGEHTVNAGEPGYILLGEAAAGARAITVSALGAHGESAATDAFTLPE
jgi:hypothetical protein